MNRFDKKFWKQKYNKNKTGWDIGYASTPLQIYFEQLTSADKNISILIPGGGNGYEAEFLCRMGFNNVHLLDIVKQPLKNLHKRLPNFPEKNLINADFFKHQGNYDIIIEQTFFCALDPQLRKEYAKKMHELLADNGKLVGLLFDFPLTDQGPPFGGSKQEYLDTFSGLFAIKVMEKSYNSIKERSGMEQFIIFEKL